MKHEGHNYHGESMKVDSLFMSYVSLIKVQLVAVGEARIAVFWPTSDWKEKTFQKSGFLAERDANFYIRGAPPCTLALVVTLMIKEEATHSLQTYC